ncbi:putative DNA mismatch repair protein MSH6 [Blattamonas nauphoetae]|uniref:DNA mismatch repair protein MSH6 n=1 Tax=Blattamonas nauphoetae TaxID=2049346 RepID=A0ABQ9XFC9_9EUKA|nr:putative DNA mismatch repair protein MSH6 [Blattamonas nauphoetae]
MAAFFQPKSPSVPNSPPTSPQIRNDPTQSPKKPANSLFSKIHSSSTKARATVLSFVPKPTNLPPETDHHDQPTYVAKDQDALDSAGLAIETVESWELPDNSPEDNLSLPTQTNPAVLNQITPIKRSKVGLSPVNSPKIDDHPELDTSFHSPRLSSPPINPTVQSPKSTQFANPYTPQTSAKAFPPSSFERSSSPVASGRLDWLEYPLDSQMRPTTHPDYDASTIYIPPAELSKLTPFERQYWLIKRNKYDYVLFFQKGKFYELYEKDADIGARVLDLKMVSRVNMRMCGVPEVRFADWAKKLLRLGYKVARVDEIGDTSDEDETGTPIKKKPAASKVQQRELTQIYTRGTIVDPDMQEEMDRTYLLCVIEGDAPLDNVTLETPIEVEVGSQNTHTSTRHTSFGVCLLDAAFSTLYVGEFNDDACLSALSSLISINSVSEALLCHKHTVSDTVTLSINNLRQMLTDNSTISEKDEAFFSATDGGTFLAEYLAQHDSEFDESTKLQFSKPSNLFKSALGACMNYLKQHSLDQILLPSATLTPLSRLFLINDSNFLIMDSATITNLEIFSRSATKNTQTQSTQDGTLWSVLNHTSLPCGKRLLREWVSHPLRQVNAINTRLDSVETLVNDEESTCLSEMLKDLASSAKFDGERIVSRLKTAVKSCQEDVRRHRLQNIDENSEDEEVPVPPSSSPSGQTEYVHPKHLPPPSTAMQQALTSLTAHGGGVRLAMFIQLLEQLVTMESAVTNATIQNWSRSKMADPSARRLVELMTVEGTPDPTDPNGQRTFGQFPNVKEILRFFTGALSSTKNDSSSITQMTKTMLFSKVSADGKKSRRTFTGEASSSIAVPSRGLDPKYDEICDELEEISAALDTHVKEAQKLLTQSQLSDGTSRFRNDSRICLKTIGNDPCQLEVPEQYVDRVPDDWDLLSKTKDVRRYWTPFIKQAISRLSELNIKRESRCRHFASRMQVLFCEYHSLWSRLYSIVAEIDCLVSLAIASKALNGTRPTIVPPSGEEDSAVFDSKDVVHPCYVGGITSSFNRSLGKQQGRSERGTNSTFIPNDISVGGLSPSLLLLTGPNMGGKSVFLKTTALCCVLAQIGCFVPARSCSLTPIDRIFVRAGATDRIMIGQSTLFVEMLETAQTLNHATKNSLVILDELGRGTATHDGAAIAYAVLKDLVTRVGCRTLVATHHHSLAMKMAEIGNVQLCYMACQTIGNPDDDKTPQDVIFLYKVVPGICPRSFGMNVARLAGMPDGVVEKANQKAKELERNDKRNVMSDVAQTSEDGTTLPPMAVSLFSRLNNLSLKAKTLQRRLDEANNQQNTEEIEFIQSQMHHCVDELHTLSKMAAEVVQAHPKAFSH